MLSPTSRQTRIGQADQAGGCVLGGPRQAQAGVWKGFADVQQYELGLLHLCIAEKGVWDDLAPGASATAHKSGAETETAECPLLSRR